MIKKTLGSRIRESRKQSNLTQDQLARSLGISKRTIVYYESDKNSPTVNTLNEIAKICKRSVEYLLIGKEESNSSPEIIPTAGFKPIDKNEGTSFSPYEEIAERIRKSANLIGRTDSEIARVLGVARQSVQGYKLDDKFPASRIVSFCLNNNVSLDWMATGLGPINIGGDKSRESDITFWKELSKDERLNKAIKNLEYIFNNADAVEEVGPLLGRIEALYNLVQKQNQK